MTGSTPPADVFTLQCCDCGQWLTPDQFHRTGAGRPKRYCRACGNARQRDRYRNDPAYRARRLASSRRYRQAEHDYVLAMQRDYYAKNRERLKEEARQRFRANNAAHCASVDRNG